MRVACYIDYTCPYSYRARRWLRAVEAAGGDRFHDAVFDALHRGRRRLDPEDLAALARAAGVDTAGFDRDRARWLRAAAVEHHEAAARYGVFGTPTLVLDPRSVVFVKLASAPAAAEALRLWQALGALARGHPELVEIKRPAPVASGEDA